MSPSPGLTLLNAGKPSRSPAGPAWSGPALGLRTPSEGPLQ